MLFPATQGSPTVRWMGPVAASNAVRDRATSRTLSWSLTVSVGVAVKEFGFEVVQGISCVTARRMGVSRTIVRPRQVNPLPPIRQRRRCSVIRRCRTLAAAPARECCGLARPIQRQGTRCPKAGSRPDTVGADWPAARHQHVQHFSTPSVRFSPAGWSTRRETTAR